MNVGLKAFDFCIKKLLSTQVAQERQAQLETAKGGEEPRWPVPAREYIKKN